MATFLHWSPFVIICEKKNLLPILEGEARKVRVIIAYITRYLLAQKIGALKSLVLAIKFNFGYNKSFVVAVELVNLKSMATTTH